MLKKKYISYSHNFRINDLIDKQYLYLINNKANLTIQYFFRYSK